MASSDTRPPQAQTDCAPLMADRPKLDTNSLGQLQLGGGRRGERHILNYPANRAVRPSRGLFRASGLYYDLVVFADYRLIKSHQFLHFWSGRAFLVVICGLSLRHDSLQFGVPLGSHTDHFLALWTG